MTSNQPHLIVSYLRAVGRRGRWYVLGWTAAQGILLAIGRDTLTKAVESSATYAALAIGTVAIAQGLQQRSEARRRW